MARIRLLLKKVLYSDVVTADQKGGEGFDPEPGLVKDADFEVIGHKQELRST